MPLMSDTPISVKNAVENILELTLQLKESSDQASFRTQAKEEKLITILTKFHNHMKSKNEELTEKVNAMPKLDQELSDQESLLLNLNKQKQYLQHKLKQLEV